MKFSSNLCMVSIPLGRAEFSAKVLSVPQSRGPITQSRTVQQKLSGGRFFGINTAVANCMVFKGFGLAQDIFLQESSVNASRGVRSLAQHQRYKLRLEQVQKKGTPSETTPHERFGKSQKPRIQRSRQFSFLSSVFFLESAEKTKPIRRNFTFKVSKQRCVLCPCICSELSGIHRCGTDKLT